jgi:hypothetical protein
MLYFTTFEIFKFSWRRDWSSGNWHNTTTDCIHSRKIIEKSWFFDDDFSPTPCTPSWAASWPVFLHEYTSCECWKVSLQNLRERLYPSSKDTEWYEGFFGDLETWTLPNFVQHLKHLHYSQNIKEDERQEQQLGFILSHVSWALSLGPAH